ncbi:MAG: hypothetical protein DGJ47_000165 [Rickettsiaceae bacterium]
MQVQISGQHISLSESLQKYVENRTQEVVQKYFADAPNSHVYFSQNHREFTCDIVVNEGTGRHIFLKSHAVCDDVYSAYDQSISKMEKQLRKYKSKLRDHSNRIKPSEALLDAVSYTISSEFDHEGEDNMDNPAIISEEPVNILNLSVGQAVMHMDLHNLPTLMFRNIKNDRINVVYYRKDGNISWVDHK